MFFLDHVQLAMPPGREAEARRFYRDLVGLQEVDKPEALKARGGVWFMLGEHQLHLGIEDPFTPAAKAHPGIACANLEALAGRLRSANFQVEWDANLPNTRRLYTSDPFGNRLEFLSGTGY